ncbi:MAG: hypothetical protein FJ295_10515 [Planctomycetes bacterium]|nr:hypothetical protein [Planctomycetota bacterium]
MASPFAVFRRNQRVMLAIFGVICMIVFVVGYNLDRLLSGTGRDRGNNTVVTWSDGAYDEFDLAYFWNRHNLTNQFLAMLARKTMDDKGTPHSEDLVEFRRDDQLLDVILLAHKAEQMGIVVNDQTVNDYLREFCDGKLTGQEREQTIKELMGDRRSSLTDKDVFEQIRLNIAARMVREIAFVSSQVTTPASVWKHYNRLNRRIKAEILPVAVADFVDKVREPSDAEVTAFYEKHKNQPTFPDSPEPGFMLRKKIAVRYFKIEFEKLLEEHKSKLTDEEIQKEYEARISRGEFKEPELPKRDPLKDEQSPEPAKPEGEPAKPEGEPAKPEGEPAKPEGEPAKPEGELGCGEDPPAGGNAQEPALNRPSQQPTETPPAGTQPAGDDAKQGEEPLAEKPQEGTEPPAQPKFKPLTEVRDQVATILARPMADAEMNRRIDEARRAAERFGREWHEWNSEPDKSKEPVFDYKSVAESLGIEAIETPLEDVLYYVNHELNADRSSFDAFSDRVQINRAQLIRSVVGGAFIWWKIKEEPSRTPALSEIRSDVIQAWKLREAVRLARQEAESLAAKAGDMESLKTAFGEEMAARVIETSEFTWMSITIPLAWGGSPSLGKVDGVETPGSDFMETVFKLKEGEIGVALDQPETHAYVVRIAKDVLSESDRRSRFMIGRTNELFDLSLLENRDIYVQWITDVRSQMKVEWRRPPRMLGQSE